MKVLLIKPKRFGDLILLTPTISAIKKVFKLAEIDVVIHEKSAGLLDAYKNEINNVWEIKEVDGNLLLPEKVFSVSYEVAIEFSGRCEAAFLLERCNADKKCYSKLYGKAGAGLVRNAVLVSDPNWDNEHAVRRDWLVSKAALGLTEMPEPVLDYPIGESTMPEFDPLLSKRFAVLHPGTSRDSQMGERKMWSVDKWRDLVRQIFANRIVDEIVFSFGPAPWERALAESIAVNDRRCRIPDEPISLLSRSALFRASTVYIGCDTGIMHFAAACGAKIVAIWGPSRDNVWAPFCDSYRLVSENRVLAPNQIFKMTSAEHENRSIEVNEVQSVLSAITELVR